MVQTLASDPWPLIPGFISAHGRVYLLCLLTTALGGTWILEQPSGSAVEYYPSWRRLCTSLMRVDLAAATRLQDLQSSSCSVG